MADIIDIDTGSIITGEKTIEQMGEEILEYCIKARAAKRRQKQYYGLGRFYSMEKGSDPIVASKRASFYSIQIEVFMELYNLKLFI
jgi:hypothetical protein